MGSPNKYGPKDPPKPPDPAPVYLRERRQARTERDLTGKQRAKRSRAVPASGVVRRGHR